MKYICYFLVRVHLKQVKSYGFYRTDKRLQMIPHYYSV